MMGTIQDKVYQFFLIRDARSGDYLWIMVLDEKEKRPWWALFM